MPDFIDSTNPNNPSQQGTSILPPVKPDKPSVFEEAGALQALAATEGAAAETQGIGQAIKLLQQLVGGGSRFADVGSQGLAGIQQGSTVGGFGDRLNQIIGGNQFRGLVDERQRGVQGQLAAGGLTRSGAALEAASAVPTELALDLEQQLFGRQAGLANLGFQQEGRDIGISQLIASLLGQSGAVTGEGIRGAAEAEAGGILGEEGFLLQQQQAKDQNKANLLGLIGTGVGAYFGGPIGAGIGGGIGSSLGSAFSDPRLKENVRIEGKIGPLDLVRWDWIDEVKDTIVSQYKTIGFMSTQVKEHYPEFVSEFGGFDVINYTGLMEALDG